MAIDVGTSVVAWCREALGTVFVVVALALFVSAERLMEVLER